MNGILLTHLDADGNVINKFHTHWARVGLKYQVSKQWDILREQPADVQMRYHLRSDVEKVTTSRYFSEADRIKTNPGDIMLNMYDGAYSPSGGTSYIKVNVPIMRFTPYYWY